MYFKKQKTTTQICTDLIAPRGLLWFSSIGLNPCQPNKRKKQYKNKNIHNELSKGEKEENLKYSCSNIIFAQHKLWKFYTKKNKYDVGF